MAKNKRKANTKACGKTCAGANRQNTFNQLKQIQ